MEGGREGGREGGMTVIHILIGMFKSWCMQSNGTTINHVTYYVIM